MSSALTTRMASEGSAPDAAALRAAASDSTHAWGRVCIASRVMSCHT